MSDSPERPRTRIAAGSQPMTMTHDSVANYMARYGISAGNLNGQTTYAFNPISRYQQLLEWAYRGSWVVGAAVDVVADDMTRAGVQLNSDTSPDDKEKLAKAINDLCLWQSLNETIKWSRLYGGALMVMLIDGQDPATPLDPQKIAQDQLKGFVVLDRWMVQPTFSDLITDFGPDYGMPRLYNVVATAPFMPQMHVHHSRCIRMDGIALPFRQKLAENGWGMSVLERMWDRLISFDSGTMGAAQLLYKAYLRTYKVKDFRRIVTMGGDRLEGFMRSNELMRAMQSNEGMTVIDQEDEFETHSYNFGGLSDTLLMLGQQVSGALGIPLVRLFGQSPAGLSATGESDLRNYYDMIRATQEARLRRPLTYLFDVLWRSVLGTEPPPTFGFGFTSLWQMDEMEKSEVAQRDADTVKLAHEAGIITTQTALRELKQSSIATGRFTNISDEEIEDAAQAPPPWEQQQEGMNGEGGGMGEPKVPGQNPPSPGKQEGEGGESGFLEGEHHLSPNVKMRVTRDGGNGTGTP